MAINFVIAFIVMYFVNRGIKKGLKVFFDEEKKEMPTYFPNKSLALVIAVISSIIVGIIFTPKVILFASNVSFEKTDYLFNLDISFYMFIEPLIKMTLEYIIRVLIFLGAYSAIYFICVFNRYFDGIDKETLKKGYLINRLIKYIREISIVFAIYNLAGTVDVVFSNFLTTRNGTHLVGAGMTDVSINIVYNVLLSFVIVITTFLVTSYFKKENKSRAIKCVFIIPTYMVCMFALMFGFDMIFVRPNQYDKEKKYIERNISNTKEAYGINTDDETIEFSGTITTSEINDNRDILDNAIIIDKNITLENLNSEQSEKGYYTYKTTGLSRYIDDDINDIIYISPREIRNVGRTFNSKTFEYTHGYSAILTSATSTTENGSIVYIKNEDYIKRPQIYYGLRTDSSACINETGIEEYDYIDSKGIEHTSKYNGNSGLNLGFFDRLILATKTKDLSLAFSNKISKDTRILINRNIIKRAKLVLSDVIFDENPYVVVDEEGNLFWVLDAYTVSDNYPYSTYSTVRCNGEKLTLNYIRNSIKIIINCYDGSMKFYITDTTDPIAMAYRKMYPDVFESTNSKIPEDIARSFVYPKFLYDIQSSMLEEYHNVKAEVLYRSDDGWKKASYVTTQNNKTTTTVLDSYYTAVNSEKIGLVQMYTPRGKQNLTAYLVGTVENGKNKLKISRLSSNESILGLSQLDSKIAEDVKMKEEIESLDVTGAKVTKRIMVVPVENTLIYIEQIYQAKTNETNTMPLLKKVIVASGNKMAIGSDLKKALTNLVSQEATSIDTYSTDDLDGIIQAIIKANKNLNASIELHDLELMGADIKALQNLIDKLEAEKIKEEKNKESNSIENILKDEDTYSENDENKSNDVNEYNSVNNVVTIQ